MSHIWCNLSWSSLLNLQVLPYLLQWLIHMSQAWPRKRWEEHGISGHQEGSYCTSWLGNSRSSSLIFFTKASCLEIMVELISGCLNHLERRLVFISLSYFSEYISLARLLQLHHLFLIFNLFLLLLQDGFPYEDFI